MARMAGKVAIVTGAAQGIGEATATIMAREGAKVVVADYNADGAKAVAEAIRGTGGDAHALFVDATKEESVRELIAKSRERYGFVNVMHNNVGGTEPVKDVAIADIDVADWDAIFNLTLKSTLFGCKHVIPLMLEHGGGAIVNTASMAGVHGGLALSAYGGAKSGVIGLTRYVATQYALAIAISIPIRCGCERTLHRTPCQSSVYQPGSSSASSPASFPDRQPGDDADDDPG